jgi:hypothetical protein
MRLIALLLWFTGGAMVFTGTVLMDGLYGSIKRTLVIVIGIVIHMWGWGVLTW